ncbi:Uncharacterized protein T09_2737, partial [Trichinella sp. T9]
LNVYKTQHCIQRSASVPEESPPMMAVGELLIGGESSAGSVGRLASDQADPMDDELVRRVDSYLLDILDDDNGSQDIDAKKPSSTLLSSADGYFTASENDQSDSNSPMDRSSSLSYGSLGEGKPALGSSFDVASLSSSSRSSSAPAMAIGGGGGGGDSSSLLSVNLSPVLEQLVRLEIEQGAGYNDTTTASSLSAPNTANNDNYYKYYCSSWSNSNGSALFHHSNNNNNHASVWSTGDDLFNQHCGGTGGGYDGWNASGSSCGSSSSSTGDSVWSPAGIWKEPKLDVTINGTGNNGINGATPTPTTVGTTTATTRTTTASGWLFGDNWDSSTQQPSVVKIDAEPPRYVSCYMSPSQRLACEQMASEMARRRALSRMAPLLPMAVNPVLASDGTFGFLAPRPNPSYFQHQDDLMTMKEIYCRNGGAGQPMAPLWSGVPLCYDVPAFGGAGPQAWYPFSAAYPQYRPYYGPLKGGNRRNDSLLDLHLSYDECFEEFRLLEKDRKKTEAELARHNLGKKINSSNNIPIPRLPVAPSRIDRMLVDYFREHARVVTLLQKMEWLRSETLNSRVYEAVRAWFSSMRQLQTLRITERNNFIRNLTPIQEEIDVSNTANALKVLTKTVRRARTAMACSLILTINVQLTAEQQEMVSKFLGADALAEMLLSKADSTKATPITDDSVPTPTTVVAEGKTERTAPHLFTAFPRQQLSLPLLNNPPPLLPTFNSACRVAKAHQVYS